MSFKKRLLSYITTTGGETWLREVEWLQNPYSQANSIVPYIDTGVFPSWDVPFEMSATITKTTANRILVIGNYANVMTFWVEVTATNRVRFGSQDSTSIDPTFATIDAYTSGADTIPMNVPTKIWAKYTPRNDAAHTIDYEVGLEALDGSVKTSTTGTGYRSGTALSTTRTLRMFNDYRSAVATFDGGFKMHQLELKYGTTSRKYIPCIDKYEIPCMYEQVEGKLYYNKGTGNFNIGRQIIEVEWINLTGYQRFNTGFYPNELSTTVKTTFEINSESLSTFPFGVRKTTGQYVDSCTMYVAPVVSGSPYGYLRLDWSMQEGSTRYKFVSSTELITLEATGNYANVNGTEYTASAVTDYTQTAPFYIGNCFTVSSQAFQSAYKGKFYVLALLNTYTREFYRYCVPAHDENNVGFFFDRANHYIIDNGGYNTQDMTWGDEIHPISYIYGGFPAYIRTTGITFAGHKWESDIKSVGDGLALFGAASGAANYWATNEDASAYALHTSNTTFDLNVSPKAKRTVSIDCNNLGSGTGKLTLTVEGQSVSRSATSNYNTTTAYRLFNALMVSTYPGHTYLYANRCYDRDTTKLLENLVPIQTGDLVCNLLDTETHTLENYNNYSPVSHYESLSAGDSQLGYQRGTELPCGFVELNYLESDSTQYINTGISGGSDTLEIDIIFRYENYVEWGAIFGNNTADTDNATRLLCYPSSGQLCSNLNTRSITNGNEYFNCSLGSTHHLISNKSGITVDGVTTTRTKLTQGTANTTNICLFNRSVSNPATNRNIGLKIYSYKVSDNGKPVQHLVPALRTYDNKVGMYDLINRKFLTNVGTGEFKYGIGNLYSSLKYIESTGTQYLRVVSGEIDSTYGIKMKASMVAEADNYPAGSTDNDKNRFFYFGARSSLSAWCYGWGTIYTGSSTPRYSFTNYPAGLDNFYTGRLNFLNDKKVAFENETPTTMSGSTQSFTNIDILLFRSYQYTTYACQSRIPWAQVSRGSDIIRNLVPVKRISDGELGMYDTVDGVFYTNAGTGVFNYAE